MNSQAYSDDYAKSVSLQLLQMQMAVLIKVQQLKKMLML